MRGFKTSNCPMIDKMELSTTIVVIVVPPRRNLRGVEKHNEREASRSSSRTTRRSATRRFSSSLFGRLSFGCGFRERGKKGGGVLLLSPSSIPTQARVILHPGPEF
jgi:hypothetical protein